MHLSVVMVILIAFRCMLEYSNGLANSTWSKSPNIIAFWGLFDFMGSLNYCYGGRMIDMGHSTQTGQTLYLEKSLHWSIDGGIYKEDLYGM